VGTGITWPERTVVTQRAAPPLDEVSRTYFDRGSPRLLSVAPTDRPTDVTMIAFDGRAGLRRVVPMATSASSGAAGVSC
jgi:hypothetical protein